MPLTLEQFARQLTDSGLFAADEVGALRAASRAADAEHFARELVKQKRLTAFQAQQVYAGKAKSLVLGNYVILDKLGQGGMGMVLKAEHRRMKRIVALKVLSPNVTKTKDVVARFHREVQAAAKLEHPNIVSAYDADEANGTHFFVMQYVAGEDLSSLVKTKGPLPVESAVSCVLQAARGLEFAHRQGVIHRDIKPANLLLDGKGVVKILDMGLARIEGDTGALAELTNTGAVMGTVDYMAPEQARNTKTADARSDIYSLGISLWYLLVARPAYNGQTLTERLLAHQSDPIPSLCAARSDVPAALDAVFQKLVAKRPADRYQTMTAVIDALDGALHGDVVAAVPSLAVQPSDDSKFNEFLAGLANTDAGSRGTAPHKTAVATGIVTDVTEEFQHTQSSTAPEAATDPLGLTPIARRRTAARRPGPRHEWWADRRVQIGGAAVVLVASLALMIASGKREAAAPRTAALPAGSQYALEFDGTAAHVQIPTLKLAGGPFTSEAWIEPGPLSMGCYLGAYDQGHSASLWGSSGINGFTATTPAGTRVGKQSDRLDLGRWMHVAGVFDGRAAAYFVDGKLIHQSTGFSEHEPANLQGAWLGGLPDIGMWRGRLRAVRVSQSVRYSADFTPPQQFTDDDQTLALYLMDEGQGTTLNDRSGNEHHGTIVQAEWVIDRSGGPVTTPASDPESSDRPSPQESSPALPPADDYALQFDGDDIVVSPFEFDFAQPFTFEATARLDALPVKNQMSCLAVQGGGGQVILRALPSGEWNIVGTGGIWYGNGPIRVGEQTHLAVVYTGEKFLLFLDGQLISPRKSEPSRESRVNTPRIMTLALGGGGFAGLIDEVRISRVARYDRDFTPAKRFNPDPQTFLLYHLDEGQGDIVKDSSGNDHHGKIVGATWVSPDDTAPATRSTSGQPLP
ncbi:MAG: protein kinase [Planctomycetaceae bacterium]|nr:protein kinase [Planctomycetaceae bacterium]